MIQEVDSIAAAASWIGPFTTVWFQRTTSGARRSTEPSRPLDEIAAYDCAPSAAVLRSLTPVPSARGRTRFDDTVATPPDAPQRLAAIIEEVQRGLKRLPPAYLLSHRTLAHQAQLQSISRDATRSHARLVAGTYGTCSDCAGPISLSRLQERPWAQECIYCALDI